ncbi:MAG: response regulator [Elusimicrobiota bacterium]|jgi:DNA-binding response OmpR family regulator
MKRKLLTVDDDADIRLVIRSGLSAEYEVLEAWDRATAEQQLLQEDIAVVLLDMHLPDVTGLDILKVIKARGSNAVVVVLTAHGDIESARGCLEIGANGYITKPFDMDYLRAVISDYVERRFGNPESTKPPWRIG